MSSIIAHFLHEVDARKCQRYATARYPDSNVLLGLNYPGSTWPFSISCDIEGEEQHQAVTFIIGYACGRGRHACIPHVKGGDWRDKYDSDQGLPIQAGAPRVCPHCGKVPAYPGAIYCGASCSARAEMKR